jgi:2-dehydropantoate 2-reductase
MGATDADRLYGVGAVGGTIAAALADAGRRSSASRGAACWRRFAAGPMTLRHPGGEIAVRVPVVAHPGEVAFRP